MNHSPPNNPESDVELSRLYQRSRVDEPSMHLDSAILSAARNSVDTPKKKRHIWCTLRWAIPVTTFALALLTVSLVIHQKQEAPGLLMQDGKSEMERAPETVSPIRKKGKMDSFGRTAPKTLRGLNAIPTPTTDAARDPAIWIKRIMTLKKQGKDTEAKASLKKFRVQYPDYPIPPELENL